MTLSVMTRKFGVGLVFIFMISIGIGFIFYDPDPEISEPSIGFGEEEAKLYVLNYQGTDNTGSSIVEIVNAIMVSKYGTENIWDHPSTTGYLIASPDWNRNMDNWLIEWQIDTYDYSVNLQWIIDMDTMKVYGTTEESTILVELVEDG